MLKTALIITLILLLGSFGSLMAQCTTTVTIGGDTALPCASGRLDLPVYMDNPCTVGGFSITIMTTDPSWLEFDANDSLAADTIGSRNTNWGVFDFEVHPIFENKITISAVGPPTGENLPPGDGLIFTLHIDYDNLEVSDTCQLINFGTTNVSDSTGYIIYPKILIRDSVCVEACASNLVRGDANGSGSLNGLDVIYLVAYFKGGASICLGCLCQGDVNNSGNVNGLDVTYLVAYFKFGGALDPCE